MMKVGRYTAALLLVLTGGLLLVDRTLGMNYTGYLVNYWPVILIALGLEYMLISAANRVGEKALKLDFGAILISVVISAVVIGSLGISKLPGNLLGNWDWNGFGFNMAGESGQKFEKEVAKIPLASGTDTVTVINRQGNVTIKKGAVTQIEIETVVYVDQVDQDEAARIADQSKLDIKKGENLTIEALGEEYKSKFIGKRLPRMNLTVTVPDTMSADVDVRLHNGKLDASQISVRKQFKAETSNGSIHVADISGNVQLESTNGSVSASNISGDAQLDTANGQITAVSVYGSLKVKTRNGKLEIIEPGSRVEAETNNGQIRLELAANGDYELDARNDMGSVSSEYPLEITKHSASGKIGSGANKIKLRTNNGSIAIAKANP